MYRDRSHSDPGPRLHRKTLRAADALLKLTRDYKRVCDQQREEQVECAQLARATQLFTPPKRQWVNYDFYEVGLEIIKLCTS